MSTCVCNDSVAEDQILVEIEQYASDCFCIWDVNQAYNIFEKRICGQSTIEIKRQSHQLTQKNNNNNNNNDDKNKNKKETKKENISINLIEINKNSIKTPNTNDTQKH